MPKCKLLHVNQRGTSLQTALPIREFEAVPRAGETIYIGGTSERFTVMEVVHKITGANHEIEVFYQ